MATTKFQSIRPFIGAKDFNISYDFYKELGFAATLLWPGFAVFQREGLSFYLQDSYVKDWVENTMLFIEVSDVAACYEWLQSLNLPDRYPGVDLRPIVHNNWGDECFVIDPAGVLLHFGHFK